jgi:very-short-patch-repair endonuclease
VSYDSVIRRLRESYDPGFDWALMRLCDRLSPMCESHIETMLGASVVTGFMLSALAAAAYGTGLRLCAQGEEGEFQDERTVLMMPQYAWKQYRIDWAFRLPTNGTYVFVECDGHEFHERTKEQARRDRSRDRDVQEACIPILRFTGSEIYRDPRGCGEQIFRVLLGRMFPESSGS